ncbi:folylpolyglutamate synthase [Thermogymnomonas acidicola]|uniref:Folylpolyglutamate synthase n=1 Tax=Thermogymnomonas acidicola TaxID=399579 RepID=A0AA37FA17_9ARCH|nr:folylpolyglutamate synthase/dihydrofolate synthase family protein [Thermogymnomonas acidicola]GGM77903.1 folylpolyglutamate synthase [Thermogymnomonas acidicola]
MRDENLEFLYGLTREGVKLDLEVMRAFDDMLGNPHRAYRTIHITGSNGKGSVSALLYNIMMQRFPSGLYTSPHLIEFNERILFNDRFIPDEYIVSFIGKYRPVIEELAREKRNPTFFETTTGMAFKYFSDAGARFASIEVGLGGRLDSTNIIEPEVSVITSVGYEHADKLGCSLTSISYEKGGIIKPGRPVVLGDRKAEVVDTVRRISQVRKSRLYLTWRDVKVSDVHLSLQGTSFRAETEGETYDVESPLVGTFQVTNIGTAILAAEASGQFDRRQIEQGIRETLWPARLQRVRDEPPVVVDCAHNPPAANALVQAFRQVSPDTRPVLVVGMLKDKDHFSYISSLRSLSDRIIVTTPYEENRAEDPEHIASLARRIYREVRVIRDAREAYDYALSLGTPVLVTGSIYLVGHVMAWEGVDVRPFTRKKVKLLE